MRSIRRQGRSSSQIKDRIVTRPGGLIGKVVAEGEAEIAFQQISELLAVPGIEVVGPLPDEVQLIIETAAGIFAASSHADAAEAWLQFCCAPTQAAVFRDKGLDRA